MTHEELRKHHFERLNAYRNSQEYAAYARDVGAEVPSGPLPSLIGDRWEIDRDIYQEFLEVLPPLGWKGGTFYLSEFSFGNVTAKFTKEGERYFCEFARYPSRTRAPTVDTPWGPAQHVTEIAPGIMSYSTASHGGIHLSPERVEEMPGALRDYVPFVKNGPEPGKWLEEDVDWAVAAVAFPQFFDPRDVAQAHATLKGYKAELYARAFPDAAVTPVEVQGREEERER